MGSFDRINHPALLRKVNTCPTIARQLRAWLKAGVLDGDRLFPTEEGTPQGGAISPLLANIALHGLETELHRRFPRLASRGAWRPAPNVIRYADDFVVLHPDRAVVEECRQVVSEWLREMGLELKPSKTRIGHTLKEVDGRAGFDFLGFTIRQFPAGASRSGCNTRGKKLGFRTFIRPSKESMKRHLASLRAVIDQCKNAPQSALIKALNPLIRGWCNYFSIGCSKRSFTKMSHLLVRRLLRWGYYRHPNKGRKWVARRYWRAAKGQKWLFTVPETGHTLYRHALTRVIRYTKVQGTRSPFDGDWLYWSGRLGRYPGVMPGVASLLKRQRGKCPFCGLYFKHGDVLEADHKRPRAAGGTHGKENIQLLHRHCHHRKTAQDRRGMDDNHQRTEEPDEGKLSRPVLEPSEEGDLLA